MIEVEPLSFVVITRDRRAELGNCLASIYRQEWPTADLVVVDNGSSDGTAAFVRAKFPAVRLIESTTNLGVSVARNLAIGAVAGEVCVFLDDDAEFEGTTAGGRIADYFRNRPRLGLVAFTILSGASGAEEYAAIPRADKKATLADYPCAYFPAGGFAVRRAAFLEAGRFWDTIMYSCEELDLSYRLLDIGFDLHRSGAVRVCHWAVPKARPPGQYLYNNARNRPLVAIRNLPWMNVATTTVAWWAYLAWVGLRTRQFLPLLRGVRDCLLAVPAALGCRRQVGRKTLKEVKARGGRLWW
ncbi:MAG TPA: glycosyltransferase [Urbifossiella sp.]|nr:glycosyltransferase [Urbifossiella sp.]